MKTAKSETIDRTMTLNQIVQARPEALPVLNGLGLDTCCGGSVALEEAARRHSLDLDEVLGALGVADGPGGGTEGV